MPAGTSPLELGWVESVSQSVRDVANRSISLQASFGSGSNILNLNLNYSGARYEFLSC